MKRLLLSSLAGMAFIAAAAPASASTLVVNSTSVVYPTSPAVTAAIHLNSPVANYSSVYVSPQYLKGTLDGAAVQLFAYCVDILNLTGPGTFQVVSLVNYLGGNTTKANQIAALIAANDGTADRYAGATTQAALWEAIYDNNPFDITAGNFRMDNVKNDPTLLARANTALTGAVATAGTAGTNMQFYVAKNASRQDMLFWTTSPVPEPATWLMLIFGFAAIGGAMRVQQQRKVTVRYA